MIYASPENYLPHSSPMVLLDKVIDITDEYACCEVMVNQEGVLSPFLDMNNNLPAWYAIELMAQTIGVWSGWHQQQQKNLQPEIGLLLAGRNLKSQAPVFISGSLLSVIARLQLKDDNMGSFECEIRVHDKCLVKGHLTTYQPKFNELDVLFERVKTR